METKTIKPSSANSNFLENHQIAAIESALDTYTEFDANCPDLLRQAIRHSLMAPGKRLRPALVILASTACGGDELQALPAACAVEMIHTYSLIHDDLPSMDDDDLRRGRPSCHIAFGEAVAILAGDALLTRAFELLAREISSPAVAMACAAELAAACGGSGMVGGQADDLAWQGSEGTLPALEAIHRRKTAAMIKVSVILGALVAEGSQLELEMLRRYGNRMGLAFQIVDDLLDLHGDESQMGKRGRKDGPRGKLTYPGLIGREPSEHRARELTEEACASLEPMGSRADPLRDLAHFVLSRIR